MDTRRKRRGAGLLAGAILAGGAVVAGIAGPAAALAPVNDTRYAGLDRYETARLTAEAAYPGGATHVLLARSDMFPDALAGSFFAGEIDAPVLLTGSASLHPEALTGLANLGATMVTLLGSEAALSDDVRSDIEQAGIDTDRIGGDNRYETAKLLATATGGVNVGSLAGEGRTAIVASGENFPDALAAGPIANAEGFPLLLTPKSSLAPETAGGLDDLDIDHVLLVGGTAAVTEDVRSAIEDLGITVDRRAGGDRYGTAADLATFARVDLAWAIDELILATGADFPDAVASGPLGGEREAPIVLTADPLPQPSVEVCADNEPTVTDLLVEGGLGAVSAASVDACRAAAEGEPVVEPPQPAGPTLAGYVWADSPGAAAYVPDATYQYNSTGAANDITRFGTGRYSVRMPGLGVNEGTVTVTSYATSARCKATGWGSFDLVDQFVGVACDDSAGNPVDAVYAVAFQRVDAGEGARAYVWADDATAAQYDPDPSYQHNSTGATNSISRSGVGQYRVFLPGLSSTSGHVQVTAFGGGTGYCKVLTWDASGDDEIVDVRCFDSAGNPADEQFTMVFVDGAPLVPKAGAAHAYLWASDPVSPAYVPTLAYQHSSAALAGTIVRAGVGEYEVALPGVASPGGHVQVTSHFFGASTCGVDSWNNVGFDMSIDVSCYDPAGNPIDAFFTIAWVA